MSKIALTPNATGTGVFTISSPATNTNRTLTLPDEAGTVLTSASPVVLPKGGDALIIKRNGAQSISHGTTTKVLFNSVIADANSTFNTGTGDFLPTIAGYYFVNPVVVMDMPSNRNYAAYVSLYKNGVRYVNTGFKVPQTAGDGTFQVSAIVYLNGTTDSISTYIHVYDYTSAAAVDVYGDYNLTNFSAFLVRAA
jgi:hypothetical protein